MPDVVQTCVVMELTISADGLVNLPSDQVTVLRDWRRDRERFKTGSPPADSFDLMPHAFLGMRALGNERTRSVLFSMKRGATFILYVCDREFWRAH
jgi:hypothetical protein